MPADKKFDVNDFFEQRQVGSDNKTVWMAIKPMTKEQARQAYPYRPCSKYSESRFGGNTLCDDFCFILNGEAAYCKMCQAATRNKALDGHVCPDCDGRSEYNGCNPHNKE